MATSVRRPWAELQSGSRSTTISAWSGQRQVRLERRRVARLEGRHYSCRASCGGSVILVDQAAESVAAADFACEWSVLPLVGLGRPELERTMRPLGVVVLDVDAQDAF